MEFYIKGNRLMFLSFTGVNLDICQIEKNITYIIYFSIEVYRHLIITVKSLNNTFLYKAEYKARLKKKNKVIGKILNFFDKFFSITSDSSLKSEVTYIVSDEKGNEQYLMVAEDEEEYKYNDKKRGN